MFDAKFSWSMTMFEPLSLIAWTIGVYALCGERADTLNSASTSIPAAFASSYPIAIELCADWRSLVFTVTPCRSSPTTSS